MIRFFLIFIVVIKVFGTDIIIPMDDTQSNHLKSYGLVYWAIDNGAKAEWLLNYRGGSFYIEGYSNVVSEAETRGVTYELISSSEYSRIKSVILENNMDAVSLDKAPKVAVYTPPGKFPWDDAVTLALTYAEIPFDTIWDREVIDGKLGNYDWLHLHHEDFTGQYGKFYGSHRNKRWYIEQKIRFEKMAKDLGFSKVSKLKLAVVIKIKQFMLNGGFLFAMCSATDSYDIALSAMNTDICKEMFDGDPSDPNCQEKLDYSQTIAFKDFKLIENPIEYEFSDIDMTMDKRGLVDKNSDYFTLFEFSAKFDPIPAILTQNHTKLIKGFMGQTTSFRKNLVKKSVTVLGERKASNEAKYIHGEVGEGFFTFYGGHDPEDYRHFVDDPPTELDLHPNSPGYRLILNNVLFPATNKKKRKT
ncbi:MAG: asparagine synthetase B [Candidatus Cloacimonadota bacterium]|nr:MAG: asparagine synthetase B [Candidatus Cloacimonadota bacterium]PIE78016.1 MAG: asparagine synthetase B [Candidatus Delongbacteria bacterium]